MNKESNRQQQLIEMRQAFAELVKQAKAADAEMVAYLVEMALIQVEEDLVASSAARSLKSTLGMS